MLKIKDVLTNGEINLDSIIKAVEQVSDLGDIKAIKERVTGELFDLYVAINLIGGWQSDGWWGIISENAKLVPFAPSALRAIGRGELADKFEKIIALFPDFTSFSNDDDAYCDIINFLQNVRFKVSDERLNSVPQAERKRLADAVSAALDELEEATEPLWGYGSDGWSDAIKFASLNLDR